MSNSSDNLEKMLFVSDEPTKKTAQEIFKKSLTFSYQVTSSKKTFSNSLSLRNKKFNFLRKLSTQYLKKSANNLTLQQSYKGLYNKALKNFYEGYKLSIYSFVLLVYLRTLKKLQKTYQEQKNLYKTYFKIIYPKLNLLDIYCSKLFKTINNLIKKIFNLLVFLKLNFALNYKKNLRFYSSSSNFLNFFYQMENKIFKIFYKTLIRFQKQINYLKTNTQIKVVKQNLLAFLDELEKTKGKIKQFFLYFLAIDKKQFFSYSERFILIFSIYFLPFIFLSTQALVPLIDEYEYVIVNPVTSSVFNKIPFLIDLIKVFRPIITNPMLLFWVPLGYYLTFTSAYRSLKISYKVAYNGTIAAIFLIINYSCVLMQFMMKLAFDSVKIIHDIFFTSYLIKHLGKNKNKERDEAMKVFASLVKRYDSEIRKNYYEFLLLINHRIFSHLAFLSLAALVYNCIYYIIHNKNPEIILVTKTALATIKNPQEEE
uniref:Uncharacterized protein n=1 Tax=Characiopsis acuta TaxID=2040456 RepID=A0A3R5QQW0_9STRA|nr:hypothetical protein Ycf60 [Characiopsis acuta]QAA11284.1 hypothetical protein Ycf60 [Characiopsis acuta]